MDRVRADLRQLDNLDIAKQGVPISKIPARRTVSGAEKDVLKSAVDFSTFVSSNMGYLREPINVCEKPPSITVMLPKIGPVGMTPRPTVTQITLAVGVAGSAFAAIGATGQVGLYGSNSPELGVFASLGGGWWSNVGAGIGPAITLIFGPPADLGGVSIGIGCDVGFMAGSVSGLLLFSPPPFKFLGISVGLSVGPTAIPAFDVTVQVSNTWTKPLLK
jgi:hypothetical protein